MPDFPPYEEPRFESPDLDGMTEGEQCHEVYAWAGLALYQSQVLEHGIANYVVMMRSIGLIPEVGTDLVDQLFDEAFRKTLGQAIAAAKKVAPKGAIDAALLEEVRVRRNFLAHEFFREHAVNFTHRPGRDTMIEQLRMMCVVFCSGERDIRVATHALLRELGVSPLAMIDEYENLLSSAESEDRDEEEC